MPLNTPEERRRAESDLQKLAKASSKDGGFLPLAELLYRVRETDSEWFLKAIEAAGIKPRRGFALAKVHEVFGGGSAPVDRLSRIGWSKLATLSSAAAKDPKRIDELLADAERLSARELDIMLASGEALDATRTVILTFSPDDYRKFEVALERFKAVRKGRGFARKERALIEMIEALAELQGWSDGLDSSG